MPKSLPADPNLDWLKKTAKQRLKALRAADPAARLNQAQRAVAADYGFKSWRALKAHVVDMGRKRPDAERVFRAAKAGDTEAVRRAFEAGFDPATPDAGGETVYQIAKEARYEAMEILARDAQGAERRPPETVEAVRGILDAAQKGEVETLGRRLDANPELIDALGGLGFKKATALQLAAIRNRHGALRLLIARGADLERRDFPDNATALHMAAAVGDLETIRLLVEAGADVNAGGDDYALGVLGWACCLRRVRDDVAAYLLAHGARLTLWTAIALDAGEALREMVGRDPSLLSARMGRNQHRRTALHHAAAKNRPGMVRLLLELGADPLATDATGATALATASQENADPEIAAALLAAGTPLDFLTAVNQGRLEAAEAMLKDDPGRLRPDGRDTIALHLAVSRRKLESIRWLISHGVDVNAKRPMWDCNHTALHMCVERGELEIARLLLDAGADPNLRDDKYRATALGWAAFFGRVDIAQLIEERGGTQ